MIYIPPIARANGMTVRTYCEPQLGVNLFDFNFQGRVPLVGQAQQKSNGSVYLAGNYSGEIILPGADGSGYGANQATAKYISGAAWKGVAFKGSMTVRIVCRLIPGVKSNPGVLPFPCLWMRCLPGLLTQFHMWGGDPTKPVFAELDILQYAMDDPRYGVVLSDLFWYKLAGLNSQQFTAAYPDNVTNGYVGVFPGDYNDWHEILYVKNAATPTTLGNMRVYIDGKEWRAAVNPVPTPMTWKFPDETQPLPPIPGEQLGALKDLLPMVLIVGTGPGAPVHIEIIEVFQPTDELNLRA